MNEYFNTDQGSGLCSSNVKDAINKYNYTDDIDNQNSTQNYTYDGVGNMISDASEEISAIEWNVYGKITRIKRLSNSTRPDLEFEYSPDGHRVVKIVKPKDGTMNVYTYYLRDAQGNVLATYNRTYSITLDYSQMTYAKVNDTIIKYETLAGLAGFNATVSNVSGLRSAFYSNLQNDTTFAKTINPYNLLINYPGGLDSVLNNLSNEAYAELLFNMNPSITDLCECFKTRNQNPDYLNSILLTMMRDEGAFDDLLDRIAAQQGNAGIFAAATSLGLPISDFPTTISDLHAYVFSSTDPEINFQNLATVLSSQYPELNTCSGLSISILSDLKRNFPNSFYAYLGNAIGVRELFRISLSSCTLAQSDEDIASRLSNNYAALSWQLLIQTNTNANLLAWERDSDSYTFTNQAIKYQKNTLAGYQTNNNLYGGPYGGMENYFNQIKSYFGQTKYDQMIQGFMRASSLYMDTIKLAEWHIYGSSRIGIYQANLCMASRSVRVESGTETQVNSTTIAIQSYTYFTTERGAKRFELTNHLGNVLAVVTDKKVAACSTEIYTYWKAELVSATDYSPFGSPMPGRNYNANQYRYGFNSGSEKDDEISGVGNHYTTEWRELDSRLGGRWWSPDPIVKPWESPYAGFANNPIYFSDPTGLDKDKPISNPENGDVDKNSGATYDKELGWVLPEVKIKPGGGDDQTTGQTVKNGATTNAGKQVYNLGKDLSMRKTDYHDPYMKDLVSNNKTNSQIAFDRQNRLGALREKLSPLGKQFSENEKSFAASVEKTKSVMKTGKLGLPNEKFSGAMKYAPVIKLVGTAAILYQGAVAADNVHKSDYNQKVILKEVGGLSGALLWGSMGATYGAAIGGPFAPLTAVAGGLIGGAAGYWVGSGEIIEDTNDLLKK